MENFTQPSNYFWQLVPITLIIGRGNPRPASQSFLETNFMLRHEAYVNPIDFVLKNDHVTFMGMSETHAWFR